MPDSGTSNAAADARLATEPARRGIGKTVVALYRALAVARPGWEFRLICRATPEPGLFAGCPNVVVTPVEMPGDRLELWRRVRLPPQRAPGVNTSSS